jgi:carboxymethylenebutenolidase
VSSDPKGLGALFDAHTQAEFEARDIETTMATMSDCPHITNVPTMTGGFSRDSVRHLYDSWFVGRLPEDWAVKLVSRTVGEDQVVDEVVISFTHDRPMQVFLPGVPPTGRKVTIPLVVVVGCKDGKVAYEHIYWDQASLLVQIGLLDKTKLPVTGAEQVARLLDPKLPSNTLIPENKLGLGLLRRGALSLRFSGEPELTSWPSARRRRLPKAHQPWAIRPAPQPSATQ